MVTEASAADLPSERSVSETSYRDVFDRVSEGVLVADRDGRYVDANPAALELLGFDRDELLRLCVADIMCGTAEHPAREYERFMTHGRWVGPLQMRRSDGSPLPVHADAKTISTPSGRVVGITVIRPAEDRRQAAHDVAAWSRSGALVRAPGRRPAAWFLTTICALGLVAAATGVAWILPHERAGVPAFIYLFAIFLTSLLFGIRAGLLGSIVATVLLDAAFIGASNAADIALLAVFFVAALLASWVPARFARTTSRTNEERDRSAAMAQIVSSLAQARTIQEVGASVVHVAGEALGARAAALYLVSNDGHDLELVLGQGYPANIAEGWPRFPVAARVPVADAVRTGQPILLGSIKERTERYDIVGERPAMGPGSLAALPMLADDAVIGAITFSFQDDHRFHERDVVFLRAFTLQCAQAIERARLAENEARLRERAEFLGEVGEALAASLDYEKTLEDVARLAVPRFADWAAVDMLGEEDQIELVAVAHRDPDMVRWARDLRERTGASLSDETGVGHVIRTGEAAFYPELSQVELEQHATSEQQLEIIRRLALRSVIIAPFVSRGAAVGALTLVHAESGRRYDRADFRVGQDIARRAAVAIDNARLFRERDRIARSLEEILLPPSLPAIPGFEVAAIYHPGSAGMDVGGDFYDVFRRQDGTFGIAIGDVCGHGPEAAAVMGVARQTIRVAGMTASRPSAILEVLNQTLMTGEYERFVTVADVRVRRGQGRAGLSVCLAGHPPPMLLAADGRVRPVGEPGMLLGAFPNVSLTDSDVEMQPGDALILYTDGLLEWPSRVEVIDAFHRLLSSMHSRTADEIVHVLDRWWRDGTNEQARDDAAVLVLRFVA